MADDSIRYDAVTVQVKAQLTPEGFLRDSPIIGRSGVQIYRRADGTTRREYRPPDVVFDANSLAMVSGIPIIDKHAALINSTNVKQHIVGTVLGSARQDSSNPTNMVSDIVIYDTAPIKAGRKELSLAYGVRTDETPGTTPEGEAYDARITAITRYDHLAIVEKGRAGVAKLRLDSDDAVSSDLPDIELVHKDSVDMANDPTTGGNPSAPANPPVNGGARLVTVRLDGGIEYQAPPEVERALTRAQEAATAAATRADKAEAERDTLVATVAGHEAALVQARTDGAAAARIRLQLEGIAKEHEVEIRKDATDRAIRELIIKKLDNKTDINFDGKSDEYVNYRLDGALEKAAEAAKNNKNNRVAINGGGQNIQPIRNDSVNNMVTGRPVISSAKQAQELARLRR